MPRVRFERFDTLCNAELFFWQIEESCEELSELIGDGGLLLAEAKERFKSPGRQREWLAVRALLQQTPYKGSVLCYSDSGKPCFADGCRFLSISHTDEYVVVVVSNTPVGIDVETKNRNAYAVMKSFLQPREIEYVMACDIPADEALLLWSAKEAAFKLASDKVAVLKEICMVPQNGGYKVIYPDGATAVCSVHVLGKFVLSIAVF